MLFNYDNTGVTVELGEIIDSGVKLWDFDYPVPRPEIHYNGKVCKVDFDKATFEQKVIDHYRFRQIGQETVGRFLHYFRAKIREIMPYYVQVYEFDAKFRNIEDPLESYNLVETFQQEVMGTGKITGSTSTDTTGSTTRNSETSNTGTTTRDSETTNTGNTTRGNNTETTGSHDKTTKFSDTPQGTLSNLNTHLTSATMESGTDNQVVEATETVTDTQKVIVAETVADTQAGDVTETASETGTATGTSTQNTEDSGTASHTLTRKGNIGVQPLGGEVINIRSAFINIDMQIIEELRDLFLMVY